MIKKIITAALVLLAAVPAVAAEPAQRFTREGVTYVYTTKVAQGRTVITGRADGGSTFRLVVKGNRVSGTSGGLPVAFALADVQRTDTGGVMTAAN